MCYAMVSNVKCFCQDNASLNRVFKLNAAQEEQAFDEDFDEFLCQSSLPGSITVGAKYCRKSLKTTIMSFFFKEKN